MKQESDDQGYKMNINLTFTAMTRVQTPSRTPILNAPDSCTDASKRDCVFSK